MEPIQSQERTHPSYVGQRGVSYWVTVGAIALCSGISSGIGGGLGGNIAPAMASQNRVSQNRVSQNRVSQHPASQYQRPLRLALVDTALVGGNRPLLQFGDEGPEVQSIQALLQIMGYYSGQIDGRYQERTVLAVITFQQAAGLDGDGIMGPTTWDKLLPLPQQIGSTNVVLPPASTPAPAEPSAPIAPPTPEPASPSSSNDSNTATAPPAEDVTLPTLRAGMRGPAVASLQERLRRLGLFQGAVDGVFGSQTEAAVKAAQRSFNLNPDGIVGPVTWAALLQ